MWIGQWVGPMLPTSPIVTVSAALALGADRSPTAISNPIAAAANRVIVMLLCARLVLESRAYPIATCVFDQARELANAFRPGGPEPATAGVRRFSPRSGRVADGSGSAESSPSPSR